MLRKSDVVKRPVNLNLNAKVLDTARELGMNLSATVDVLLADEVQRRYWAQWNTENKDAIAHYNARIAREGLPLSRYRNFMRDVGAGAGAGADVGAGAGAGAGADTDGQV
jgi:antitoxin CcdA